MSEVSFGSDGDFSDDAMIRKVNPNLANELGNLLQRVITLVSTNCEERVPSEVGVYTEEDEVLLEKARTLRERTADAISQQAIHKYSNEMVLMVKDANKYIDTQAPWVLKKTDLPRMNTVLYVLMEVLRYVGILYQPLIPTSANKILDQLAIPSGERTFAHLETCCVPLGALLQKEIKAVFPRIEVEEDDKMKLAAEQKKKQKQKAKQKAKQKQQSQVPAREVDVSMLDIRVGVITKAWEHEEADSLFCEEIDIGEAEGPRQVASGLREHYKLDSLEGQRVLVLANLKTRKLMGFPSHGMVMCASNEDGSKVEFVEPPVDAKVGERIMFNGFEGDPATENQIQKKKMLDVIFPDLKTDGSGVATYKEVPFTTSAGVCKAQGGLQSAAVA